MYRSDNEIMSIFSSIENESKLPKGILRSIYLKEKDVVYMGIRNNIFEDLKTIISSNLNEFKKGQNK